MTRFGRLIRFPLRRVVRIRVAAAAALIVAGLLFVGVHVGVATVLAAPYVSCPGGYIADELEDCPEVVRHPVGGPNPRGGGGGSGSGVLGDLLDSVGLGGLGGLL